MWVSKCGTCNKVVIASMHKVKEYNLFEWLVKEWDDDWNRIHILFESSNDQSKELGRIFALIEPAWMHVLFILVHMWVIDKIR